MAKDVVGSVPEIEVGRHFTSRRELHDANVHRGLMRGIAPQGLSIVLSGGYVDDEDFGSEIIYTGEGGRDLDTGRQVRDQTLTLGNLALARNCDQGVLVRVIRGSNHNSKYSPPNGYRYDGLYRVQYYENPLGRDGYRIFRYFLERHEESYVVGSDTRFSNQPEGRRNPYRVEVTTTRVIRSTAIGNAVKRLYEFHCQACGIRLETPSGAYAECCHIRPLGKPHYGPDTLDNVLCLCANCHVLFDRGTLLVEDNFTIQGSTRSLHCVPEHGIDIDHLSYHRRNLVPE